ncbi:pyruvate carboxylase subunit B [Candidatus Latescibacterota bacterium]
MNKNTRKTTKKKEKIPLRITDTTLRDAHQSLWATRMRLEDIMEIIDVIDSVGYYSLEMWGGATFDVCLRFLRENPWERLRNIKSAAPKTPLQMLLRGQNILGYKNYADDLLDRFVALAIYNGIDIFRVFDALNDTRNLEFAIKSIKRHGGHAQGTLSYTISPYHTIETFVKAAREQVELGIDTLCIKDMAGILTPVMAEQLVSALVKVIDVPIQLHCHATSGMATATYVEGVRAGAGAIDCAISPLAGFSSQPPVETMVFIFKDTKYAPRLDLDALEKVEKFFRNLAPKMQPGHTPINTIDPGIIRHQIPGGMISNLRSQLAQQGALGRLDEVLAEVPRVRADLGWPPLVTPTSQIVGTQAVLNVIAGERYTIIPNEVKNYVRGLYGRPPKEIEPDIMEIIIGTEKPITHRPADDIPPMLPTATEHLDSSLIENEEDIISYCLFPETAIEYLKWRKLPQEERPPAPVEVELNLIREETRLEQKPPEKPEPLPEGSSQIPLVAPQDSLGIREIMAKVIELNINELVIRRGDTSISLRSDGVEMEHRTAPSTPEPVAPRPETYSEPEAQPVNPTDVSPDALTIKSPLSGHYYGAPVPGKPNFVSAGDSVKAGQPVCLVEAMKLLNEITVPADCRIVSILVSDGQSVEKGQPLMVIEEV